MKIKKGFYFFDLLPLAYCPLKTFNQDISKIVIVRSFKFGQLIDDDEKYSYMLLM